MYMYVKILAYLKEQEGEQNTHEGEDPATWKGTTLFNIDIIIISIDNNMIWHVVFITEH